MRKSIAILGCGTAGIHLAYELLITGQFDITIFTKETPEEVRTGRIRSTQVHFSSTIARERRYHMPEWPNAQELSSVHVSIGGQTLFAGHLDAPAYSVDQRLYFSECMSDLKRQGVHFVYDKITPETLPNMVDSFDLVVDCTGRTGPVAPFPVDASMPSVSTPLRKCSVGYFRGIENTQPVGIIAHMLPGEGELFEIPALTEHGPVTILFVEALSEGKLDVFHQAKTASEFGSLMLQITDSFFPEIRQRTTLEQFCLCDEHAYLRVAVRPQVRTPYCEVNGKFVAGCGDSVVLIDPITGQGDNTASYLTEQLFCALLEDLPRDWDESTFQSYWEKAKPYVNHVVTWSHAMLYPLPEHVLGMMMEGHKNQGVADRIANWFRMPSSAYNDFFHKNDAVHNGPTGPLVKGRNE